MNGDRNPPPLDEWERGFDAGWRARIEGRHRALRFRSPIPPVPNSYRAGWREGWRCAGGEADGPEDGGE